MQHLIAGNTGLEELLQKVPFATYQTKQVGHFAAGVLQNTVVDVHFTGFVVENMRDFTKKITDPFC